MDDMFHSSSYDHRKPGLIDRAEQASSKVQTVFDHLHSLT
jgi:hypothetical protein